MERDLWAECPACSSVSHYAGRAETDCGCLYGLFACPQCRVDFSVWRPGFDQQLAGDAFDAAGVLHDLATKLCRLHPGADTGMEAAVAESGVTAVLDAEVMIEPADRPCATVDLRLPRWSPQFSHLEARFGVSKIMPRTGPNASQLYGWKVRLPGAPSDVSIFAYFRHRAYAYSRPAGVLMRIDPRA